MWLCGLRDASGCGYVFEHASVRVGAGGGYVCV